MQRTETARDRLHALTVGDLVGCPAWTRSFAHLRHDHRHYELVERTIRQGFDYRYLAVSDGAGEILAIQPFFIHDQDLLDGTPMPIRRLAQVVRGIRPRFLRMRAMMIGCAAGDGHLGSPYPPVQARIARALAGGLADQAQAMNASLIVLKEFPAQYRDILSCLFDRGFTRAASAPSVVLDLDYASFDDFCTRALSRDMRYKLRRKLREADAMGPLDLSVHGDATPFIDELYPLYLNIYRRSTLRFHKLTKEYLSEIGRIMPDRARFFVWRLCGKIVAFNLSLIEDDSLYSEYIGLDDTVAFDLHLYFVVMRDLISYAIANGYRRLYGGSLNYDPKRRLRFRLLPLDLYVRHRSPLANWFLARAVPHLVPPRFDKVLPRIRGCDELW